MNGVRFGLLGTLVLASGTGERLALHGPRQRALLASLLLAANTPVSADALAEAVWDGSPPPGAATTLRSHVRRLRGALGSDAGERIRACDPGYQISADAAELDVLAFEAAYRAAAAARRDARWQDASAAAARGLEMWRGTPLLDVPSQVLRDQFVPVLEQLRLQMLEDRAEAELRLGRYDRLIPELCGLAERYPVRERFHAQLMEALARAGRRAEALDAYRRARRALVEELGIEPGPHLRLLHKLILTGDPALAAPEAEATVAGNSGAALTPALTMIPRQLPAAPEHFMGRHGELKLLAAAGRDAGARRGTVVISAIDGMAGIGKTALALHAAHQLAGQFTDGQLFLDLHGYTLGRAPRTATEALHWLLQAVGVPPERIPEDGEQAAALYRQHLAGTRTLIVLDNASDEAQVRPLLPGSGSCLVLVTSRRRLRALDDAELVSLDLLSPPDAVTLLCAVAGPGRIPPGDPLADEIAGLCGYLPLALRIAASLLRHRPSWDLDHLARQLRDQSQRVPVLADGERGLLAMFDLSYASLAEPHQRLWRRLGLVPGPDLDAYAAAALAGVDPARAARLLEDLVDHNLLIAYRPGRYRLHDLLRAHARALAGDDLVSEPGLAVDRLLHYYAHTAQSASVRLANYPRPAPDGPAPAHSPLLSGPESARSWLGTELPNLDAAFTHAVTQGLDRHALALASGLGETLLTDVPWPRTLDIAKAAADIAGRLGEAGAHAAALSDLAWVQAMTGDYAASAAAVTRALALFRTLGDRRGEATALIGLGRVRAMTGDYAASAAAVTRALALFRTLGHRLSEASALSELGRVQIVTGNYPQAGDSLTRALEVYDALGHRDGAANALTDLACVRQLTGDHPGAGDALDRALELYRAVGNRNGEAGALTDLGRVRTLTGDYPQARDALDRALELYRAVGNRNGEASALTNLGRVRTLTGDYPGAEDALTSALDIYRTLGNRGDEAWAANYYAAVLAACGQHASAGALYQQALAMNRELNKPDDEAVSLEGIGEHHLAAGDLALGVRHLDQALTIYQRLGMAPDAERVLRRLAGPTVS